MMKITRISVHRKDPSRYHLFIDRGYGEEYAFSVDEDILIQYQLKKGLELTEAQLKEIMKAEDEKKVYLEALRYLSFRMRSLKEVRTHLMKKGYDERRIEATIEALIAENYLGDEAFARAYVETKKKTTMKGPNVIREELREKGVDNTFIEDALQHFSMEEEKEKIKRWLGKKRQKNEAKRAFVEKLRSQLMRKGFSKEAIDEAFEEHDFGYDEEKEWEAICYHGEKVVRKYANTDDEWKFLQKVKQALYRRGFSIDLIERYIEEREGKR